MKTRILTFTLIAAMSASCLAAGGPMTLKAVNKLSFSRPSQTIELTAKDLAPLGNDLTKIHVKDASGKEVLCQAVDIDFDAYRKPDIVIFQADFAPGETKTFTVSAGAKQEFSRRESTRFNGMEETMKEFGCPAVRTSIV